jgi:hypothetical protein
VSWAGKWGTRERCEMHENFLSEKLNGIDHLEDLGIDEEILLE